MAKNEPPIHFHLQSSVLDTPARPVTVPSDIAAADSEAAYQKIESQKSTVKLNYKLREVNLAPAIWLVAMHVIALAAPWTFTWSALFLTIAFHWLTGGIGICLGYHRLLTHTGFVIPEWLRRTIATIGTLAGEGGPVLWTANHRRHHAHSDHDGDPHSPHDGPWWSHMFWLAYKTDGGNTEAYLKRWAPDLANDKFMMGLERYFLPIHIAFGVLVFGAGWLYGGMTYAISWAVWLVAVRMVLVLHATWLVNSASHMWGYRNYETRDDSRNLWWVGLITYGEGWHNNHHAHPRLAQHGHKWWEFDMTYMAIRFLRAVGLAKEVVDLKSVEIKKRRVAPVDHLRESA